MCMTIRRSMRIRLHAIVFVCAFSVSQPLFADGDVTIIDGVDNWIVEFDEVAIADFTEFDDGEVIPTDYYADWGVKFGNSLNVAIESVFFEDEHGMISKTGTTVIDFDHHQTGIGILAVNTQRFHFYDDDILIHTSIWINRSGGFILEKPFNRVVLEGGGSSADAIADNLYFVIPSPGALSVFALAFVSRRQRRFS